jgi:hypothetical protein
MHLIQILLPLAGNDGRRFPPDAFARVRSELAERFGGLTAFTRSPAEGLWREGDETARDDIVVLEVMADALDTAWWADYRRSLEERFAQEVVVVRAQEIRVL